MCVSVRRLTINPTHPVKEMILFALGSWADTIQQKKKKMRQKTGLWLAEVDIALSTSHSMFIGACWDYLTVKYFIFCLDYKYSQLYGDFLALDTSGVLLIWILVTLSWMKCIKKTTTSPLYSFIASGWNGKHCLLIY